MSPSRIKRAMSRARYAAIGAAIGGGLGGLFSRNMASSGAALGATLGAVFGERRQSDRGRLDGVKDRNPIRVDRLRSSSKSSD